MSDKSKHKDRKRNTDTNDANGSVEMSAIAVHEHAPFLHANVSKSKNYFLVTGCFVSQTLMSPRVCCPCLSHTHRFLKGPMMDRMIILSIIMVLFTTRQSVE